MLETGAPPWRRPWDKAKAAACGSPALALPRNAVTGARYSGINLLVLALSQFGLADGDPRWATYKQAQEQGWQVRRGEQGTPAYFFKRLEVRDDRDVARREPRAGTCGQHVSGTERRRGHGRGEAPGRERPGEAGVRHIPLLRSFTLFHASQIDGIGPYRAPTPDEAPWRTPEAVDVIVANSGAAVRYGGSRAFYSVVSSCRGRPRSGRQVRSRVRPSMSWLTGRARDTGSAGT